MSRRQEEIRNLEQNKKFHAAIRDVAEQCEWAGERMDAEDWKRLFLAAAHGQKCVPNPFDPHAAFVVINARRSRGLNVPDMADLITQIIVFGNERGVQWRDERAAA
jgi:hypothetical protein